MDAGKQIETAKRTALCEHNTYTGYRKATFSEQYRNGFRGLARLSLSRMERPE
jgi:hypothetical protein